MYFGTGTTSTDCFPAAIGCCKAVCYYCCCWGLTEKKMEYLMCKFSAPAEGRPFAFPFSLLCKLSKDLLVRIIISIGLPIVVGERTYDWHFFGSDSLWKSDFCIDWSILSSRCWFCCCISTTTATTDDPKKRAQRIRASMPPEFWHYYMAEERGVVRGVARATPIFQILFHKTVSPQTLRLSMPQTIETFSTYSYNNL